MRILLLLLTACEASDSGDGDDAGPGDTDTTPSCGDTVATAIHGETAEDVIDPGDEVPIVSGPQGGFHMELGMEVVSSTTAVAWRIDLYDVATGDLVGGVGETLFTALAAYDRPTCTGQLNGRVFIGDGSSQTHDFACDIAGRPLEARGWAAPITESSAVPTDNVEVTLEIVAGQPAC